MEIPYEQTKVWQIEETGGLKARLKSHICDTF